MFHAGRQAIIGNYAVPILEEKQVWGTNDQTRTAYLDTTDVARMTLASLRCESRKLTRPVWRFDLRTGPHVSSLRPLDALLRTARLCFLKLHSRSLLGLRWREESSSCCAGPC